MQLKLNKAVLVYILMNMFVLFCDRNAKRRRRRKTTVMRRMKHQRKNQVKQFIIEIRFFL
jgi:hypothetical protein